MDIIKVYSKIFCQWRANRHFTYIPEYLFMNMYMHGFKIMVYFIVSMESFLSIVSLYTVKGSRNWCDYLQMSILMKYNGREIRISWLTRYIHVGRFREVRISFRCFACNSWTAYFNILGQYLFLMYKNMPVKTLGKNDDNKNDVFRTKV